MTDVIRTHHAAVGVVITNSRQAVLMVQTHNRGPEALVLPGGIIELGESPARAAEREVAEEVGLTVVLRSLLVVQHKPPLSSGSAGSLMFVFDTEPVPDAVTLTLQPEEVAVAM